MGRRELIALACGAAMLSASSYAWADYPERPVRIVVGFGPGSAADVAARIVGEELSRTMGQRFFVENRAAGGLTMFGPGPSISTGANAGSGADGRADSIRAAASSPNFLRQPNSCCGLISWRRRDLRHVHTWRQALGHDRDLARIRPIPPPLGPRDNLDPPRTISPKSRDRDPSGHAMEGGGSATLTVIGKTGIGKTRLLKNIIVQDIHTGRGIGVIDPHGDLQNELLDEIPRRRMRDLVYLDPNDPDRTVTLNVIANVPREETEGEGNDAFWTRIGSAWPHKDGKGLNLVLSALPINGRLVLREYTPDDEKKDEEKKVAKFRKK